MGYRHGPWPGQIKAGTSTDQIAAHIDWYPTLQTLCHLNTLAGKPIDGKDLSGIILNKTDTLSDRKIFSHVAFLEKELKPKPGSVRTPRYRMVWKSAAAELYDMSSDPQQLVNLAATELHHLIDSFQSVPILVFISHPGLSAHQTGQRKYLLYRAPCI